MTYEEAAQILGPELTAQVDAQAAQYPPLTAEQIAHLAPLLAAADEEPAASDAA